MYRKLAIIPLLLLLSVSMANAESWHTISSNIGDGTLGANAELNPDIVDQTKEKRNPIHEIYEIFLNYTAVLMEIPIIIIFLFVVLSFGKTKMKLSQSKPDSTSSVGSFAPSLNIRYKR